MYIYIYTDTYLFQVGPRTAAAGARAPCDARLGIVIATALYRYISYLSLYIYIYIL